MIDVGIKSYFVVVFMESFCSFCYKFFLLLLLNDQIQENFS